MLDLVWPDDQRYSLSRNQFIGRPAEVLPQAVARCEGPADVREALELAADKGWPFAVRGGGHSNACHSSSTGLVIDLSPAATVLLSGNEVTVGAGVRTGQLATFLASRELLVPAGSCPSVGLVGAALGGGFGSHGRTHGLTCDRLVAAEVVLADGRVVKAGETEEPDLFWALRGAGGGNFGVVTSATFAPVRSVARTHVRYSWDIAHAPRLIAIWQEWAPFAPDDVSVELVLLSPDHPDDPPEVLLIGAGDVTGFVSGSPAPRLAEVERLSPAEAALLHATPYSAVAHDPVSIQLTYSRPGMSTAKTEFFTQPLPQPAIQALVEHFTAAREPGEMREVAFTPWGGAYSHVPPHATAFPHRQADYLVKHTVLVGPNGAARRGNEALAWLAASWATIHPWGNGGAYPNFPDPALTGWFTAYYGSNTQRLREVKAAYDPENVFRFAQSVPL
ncbi:FAD/FMN-containing dehydrogenase [Kibdelosporangium banguiense]|uniref:FAD/FMN-containing dehydrogenase n=1 Tax=Kibdelosporangium banguiense TaxID=1365924 RepID=A0ABS4TSJ4_9PSEU|nr:FAD-binding oxidoreductase [Kibdelosporangium banguiense]MBP2327381.1 FAD/FMN-containing dehydrogenase [Kibdelosporangium banguiense]